MINYPNKKKSFTTLKISTSNRGMVFEEMLNYTNEYYLSHDIASIYKKPIPIQIVKVDYPNREHAKIVEAYYKVPSTTDYNGIYRGKYIDFEAKECHSKTSFPLSNIHKHQIDHLMMCEKHGGICFVLIYLVKYDEIYLIPSKDISTYYYSQESSRKSISISDIRNKYFLVKQGYQKRVDYLEIVDKLYF